MFTTEFDKKYWSLSINEVASSFDLDKKVGLSKAEADERLITFGRNTFESSKKTGVIKIFLNQLTSPLILILIFAGIVTFIVSHYRDTVFIFVAVIINSILGFWQENKAERALSELKTYLKQRARVIRDGIEKEIDAEEIVPGDIIRLSQGDRVPGDARVIFVNDFEVDESILTGESLPITKKIEPVSENTVISEQKSMIFAGTLVTQGVCEAIVCRTDAYTELGKIASLIARSNNEKTPLQKAIGKFSVSLSVILGVLTLFVFVVGVFSGVSPLDMFLTAVAVAVSAIPEGLPISMTVILAIGVERMAKRKGVVRKLIAAEALGGTTLILTDKTGTLTMAKMILSKILPFRESENTLLSYALRNTTVLIENPDDHPQSWRMNGRIMETALVQSAALRGISIDTIKNKDCLLQSMPFNSIKKFSASLIKKENKYQIVLFGAPDILLNYSSLSEVKKNEILETIHSLALSGERVLGLATQNIDDISNFSFVKSFTPSAVFFEGLITFKDPVRPEIHHTINRVHHAGIKTIIMTGDHQGTAIAIAKEIGINIDKNEVLDASELTRLSDEILKERLTSIRIISRVTPYDKLRIVKIFQERGEVVAMTGDGVNDAPAIKQADVGIAMGSGTEVAQSVADLVLLDNNFETIVAAIEEGRQILSNIRKVLVYLLSNVADGLILIGGSIVAGVALPLNPLQILWVNFFTDSFPAIAFAFEKDSDRLVRTSTTHKKSLFDPLMRFLILVIGISTSALLFIIYLVLLNLGYDPILVKTFIFASFGTYTLLLAFSVRSLEKSIFSHSLFSNRYLTLGILIGFVLMGAAIYVSPLQNLFNTVSLPFVWVIGVFLIGIVNILLIELGKKIFKIGITKKIKQ